MSKRRPDIAGKGDPQIDALRKQNRAADPRKSHATPQPRKPHRSRRHEQICRGRGGRIAFGDVRDAGADIARRSDDLLKMQAERLQTDDGYQVIDPRTVASTFQEMTKVATVNPASIIDQQIRLWGDLARLLWQRTAARILFNSPAEPVIEPPNRTSGSSTSLDRTIPPVITSSNTILLMSRYFQASSSTSKVSSRTPTTSKILYPTVPQRSGADQFRRDQSRQ